jgi:hypothetical protein
MAQAPAPDGRHDDLEADELEGLALLVPDDPRSLEADRLAYLRELRARRDGRVRRWRRPLSSGAGLMGTGLAGPAILVLLVVVGLIGSTLSVFGGNTTATRTLTPLATDPPGDVGDVGGLLPDVQVTVNSSVLDLRAARPAVLVVVPTSCDDCSTLLQDLRAQALEYHLPFVLIGPPAQEDQLSTIARDDLAGTVRVAVDSTDAMTTAFQPSGVTAVAVHSDGVVAQVWRDMAEGQRLETVLSQLDTPTASAA